jgi:pimeloyl-ACP methyl ester carboxylesterase
MHNVALASPSGAPSTGLLAAGGIVPCLAFCNSAITLCCAVVRERGDIIVPSTDGSRRQLSVRVSGNPSGIPVFFLHGTPGSRVGPSPRPKVLYNLGVSLISFDRPGYGRSERMESRRVAHVAKDVEAIADALGIEEFAVLGRSGGGPHALACAALLPERITRAGVMVSLAPWEGMGHQWFDGMADSNVLEYTAAANEPLALATRLELAAARIKADPASHVATLGPEMPADDRRVVADAGIRALLAQNFAEALRDSANGWIDDALAFRMPWGFDPADIKAPVLLWHGADDVFSPVAHTQWLAEKIRRAEVVIKPGTAHFGALEVVPDILSWLIRTDPTD